MCRVGDVESWVGTELRGAAGLLAVVIMALGSGPSSKSLAIRLWLLWLARVTRAPVPLPMGSMASLLLLCPEPGSCDLPGPSDPPPPGRACCLPCPPAPPPGRACCLPCSPAPPPGRACCLPCSPAPPPGRACCLPCSPAPPPGRACCLPCPPDPPPPGKACCLSLAHTLASCLAFLSGVGMNLLLRTRRMTSRWTENPSARRSTVHSSGSSCFRYL
ncbi:hypothetical protein J4Q44_G00264310, partial [Coregonus suidteri]